jgi:hypothetical protein
MTPWNLSNILEAPLEGLRRMTSEPNTGRGFGGKLEGGTEQHRSPPSRLSFQHKRQQQQASREQTHDDNAAAAAPYIAFHCNYEQNCTALFKKIENHEWSSVDKFLASGIWPDTNTIDHLSPYEQARTWVSRFENSSDPESQCRWSLLPVHLVCFLFVCVLMMR